MSELVYNPFEDKDVRLPIYKKDGKNLVLPAFICGVRIREVTSKQNESLSIVEFEFEIHESAKKVQPITLFKEDDEGKYNYRLPIDETVPGSTFVGQRIKSGDRTKVWRNNTKASGRMNRMYLETLKALGVEIKTKKIEHEGKKIDAPVIPDVSEELFLGLPLFIWLDEESFTNKQGRNISFTAAGKYVKIDGMPRVEVLENSLSDNTASAPAQEKATVFDDIDDSDLPF